MLTLSCCCCILQDLPEAETHVYFDEESCTLKCKTCRQAGVDNTFAKEGCFRITKQAVQEHVNPKGKSANNHDAAVARLAGEMALTKAVAKQQAKATAEQIALARTVLFMCIALLPLTAIVGLVVLQAANGTASLAGLQGAYVNPHTAKEYAGIFSRVLDDALIAELKQSHYYSILIDESTDVSVEKHLAIYVRYIGPNYKPVERLLQLTKRSGGDAATIHTALAQTLQARGLELSRGVGFASDGASVMTGDKKGVAVRLGLGNPFMVGIHCIAHRAALAAKDVFEQFEYAKWFDTLLSRTHGFFSKSSARIEALADVQKALQLPVLRIPVVHGVRWLSRDGVATAFTRSYPALLKYFSEEAAKGCITAKELFRDVGLTRHMVMAYFFQDVLEAAGTMTKVFQERSFSFVQVSDRIAAFITFLQQQYINNGDTLSGAVRAAIAGLRAASNGQQLLDIDPSSSDGALVQRPLEDIITDCKAQMCDIAQAYVDAINARFPSMPLLEHFDVFHPKNLKEVSNEEAATYGDDAIKALAEHYGTAKEVEVPQQPAVKHAALLDGEQLVKEWRFVRSALLRKAARLTTVVTAKVFVSFFADVLSDLMGSYPVACSLIMIMLVLPAHTAEVERGFSIQNLIKSKFRAAMHVNTLDTLMRIKLLGPASVADGDVSGTAIDLNAVVLEWQGKKKRLPQRSNAGVARKTAAKAGVAAGAAAAPAGATEAAAGTTEAAAGAADAPAGTVEVPAGAAEHSFDDSFTFEDAVTL